MISESSFQLALLFELGLITSTLLTHDVAAYAAVSSTTTFAINIFNFLLITTMAQVGKAVGQQSWNEIGVRFRIALVTAVVIGCSCGIVLLLSEEFLFTTVLHLDSDVEASSREIYRVRLLLIPLMMIQRVCGGLLGGYQRVLVLAFRAVLVASIEVVSQYVALRVLRLGLLGATWGSVATAMFGVIVSLIMVVWCPPDHAERQIHVCCSCSKNQQSGQDEVEEVNEERREWKERRTSLSIGCDVASAATNTTVRSLLLTSSVYSMSVVAANLGTSALTAHQIAMTLWMLMSLVCDGFADVATLLGSKLIGEKVGTTSTTTTATSTTTTTDQLIVLRDMLMSFGLITGVVASVSMWYFRDIILDVYDVHNVSLVPAGDGDMTSSLSDPVAQLVLLWPLVCSMQVVNAVVFVLDGFVYATQSFVFIRNLMLASVLLWFFPALLIGSVVEHTLLAVWVAKAGLNLLRAVGALWLMYSYFPKQWRREREEERVGLQNPLLSERKI